LFNGTFFRNGGSIFLLKILSIKNKLTIVSKVEMFCLFFPQSVGLSYIRINRRRWSNRSACINLKKERKKLENCWLNYDWRYAVNIERHLILIDQVSISSTFYEQLLRQYFCAKKLRSQNVTREKMCNLLLYKKCVCKMLMKFNTALSRNMDS